MVARSSHSAVSEQFSVRGRLNESPEGFQVERLVIPLRKGVYHHARSYWQRTAIVVRRDIRGRLAPFRRFSLNLVEILPALPGHIKTPVTWIPCNPVEDMLRMIARMDAL